MPGIKETINDLVGRLLDLLIDATFLALWALINWLLYKGLAHLEPSIIVLIFFWVSQGVFALSTLFIIVFHVIRDVAGHGGEHPPEIKTVFTDAWSKLRDMSSHSIAIFIYSTLLVFWAAINWLLALGLKPFESESSLFIGWSHQAIQVFFAVATIWKIIKHIRGQMRIIYRKLFPKSANV